VKTDNDWPNDTVTLKQVAIFVFLVMAVIARTETKSWEEFGLKFISYTGMAYFVLMVMISLRSEK
jgi:hypothetical protein